MVSRYFKYLIQYISFYIFFKKIYIIVYDVLIKILKGLSTSDLDSGAYLCTRVVHI